MILLIAATLRAWRIGRPSLWYDEVVTMQAASQPDPAGLIAFLERFDATRAPLHPLVLMGWLRAFGSTDLAARSFSAACGVMTVAIVFLLARDAFGRRVGLWAAWLAAVCPALIRYSQEVRMYSWLVLIASVSWWLLLRLRPRPRGPFARDAALYVLSLVALAYSHPLGLLMIGTQAIVAIGIWRARGLPFLGWFLVQAGWIAALGPWLGAYLDHRPEWTVGPLPIRFLLGMPIEYVGGNRFTLALCVALIALGLGRFRSDRGNPWPFLAWFVVSPVLLFVYSLVRDPIFGPARYTLFVAPAYLILLARGLAKLPVSVALALALCGAWLSWVLIERTVYRPDLKADWRSAAHILADWPGREVVTLHEFPGIGLVDTPRGPALPEEVVADYYLRDVADVRFSGVIAPGTSGGPRVNVVPLRDGMPLTERAATFPIGRKVLERIDLPGLRLIRVGSESAISASDGAMTGPGGSTP